MTATQDLEALRAELEAKGVRYAGEQIRRKAGKSVK